MLRNFESHKSYQENLKLHLLLFWQTDRGRVKDMDKSISKLYLLNLDPLLSIIQPLYSNTGCPAKNQPGIIRSLILMLDQKHHGITSWAEKVAGDRLLCAIFGFHYGDAPSASSYYDFIKRLWKTPHKIHVARTKKLRPFKAKPRKKLKAGQKMYKNSLLPVTVPRFIPVPPITVQRSVIAKNMVSTTASVPDVIPTRMHAGAGIAIMRNISMEIHYSVLQPLIVPMIFPSI